MSLGGACLYDGETGLPVDRLIVDMEYIQTFASLLGKRYVFPGQDYTKLNLPGSVDYIPGTHVFEGTPAVQIYEDRNCPCGTKLNSYSEGPLCVKCSTDILNPLKSVDPFVLAFVRLFWPELYEERKATRRVLWIEDYRNRVKYLS